ncbi:MAG TPA: hypothetical protein VKV96_00120 [Roseiarcus sp.]|nr:hypothetical protein [Roseiarcus sp.]
MARLGIEFDRNFAAGSRADRCRSARPSASATSNRTDWIVFGVCAAIIAGIAAKFATGLRLFFP